MSDFVYTYSAPEQEEIRRIREKYLPKTETTLEALQRLDAQAERPGKIWSLVLGIVGALIFGTGMSLCLVWEWYLLGIPVGILGAALMGIAYPVYRSITKKQREKLAPQVLALTEDLQNEKKAPLG